MQPADAHRGMARAVLPGLREAQIDERVGGEFGMEDDVAQPALAAIIDRRDAADLDALGRPGATAAAFRAAR